MSERVHVFALAAALLLASTTVRCVSTSPGVAVELVFAAPPGYDAALSPVTRGTSITHAAAFVTTATLIPCDEAPRASWRALPELLLPIAHAHTENVTDRSWLGAQRVDALSIDGTPLGLLSPPARAYCAIEVTFAPDESEHPEEPDPMTGRSIGIEGHYQATDGTLQPFAVRTSQERVEVITFAAPLVLDEADDIARVTVSFDAAAWAETVNFEGSSASEQRIALIRDLHAHLAATIHMRKQRP